MIKYTVTEEKVAGYELEMEEDASGVVQLTNHHIPEITEIKGTKAWEDENNQDGVQPDQITVNLLADGDKIDSQEVSKETNWQYEFKELPKYKKGKEISYTVTEEKIKGYTTSISLTNPNNILITNYHTPELTQVTGDKTWTGDDNYLSERPTEITVNLFANKEKVAAQKVTKETNWQYEFTDLPKYEEGQLIEYTVTEDSVEGYQTNVKNYDIENHYMSGKTELSVQKTWEDNEDQDGLRPEKIEVQLYGDDQKIGEPVELTETNQWEHTWKELETKHNGQLIKYTVTEEKVAGYELEMDTTDIKNINIINKHTPEKIQIEGEKKWIGDEKFLSNRPTEIIVNLLADGEKIMSQEVTEEMNWHYEFRNLPKYEKGQLIEYIVTEDSIRSYTSEVIGFNIENKYTPEKTSVSTKKKWRDGNDQDGLRPTKIEVQLYGNNQIIGPVIELSSTNNWHYTWYDLPEKDNDQLIEYTVKEKNVIGYQTVIDDKNPNHILIINYHEPEITKIKGEKIWINDESDLLERPASIQVNLLANGKPVARQEVSSALNWQYEFNQLPKYESGKEVVYSVTEDKIPNYTTIINGTTIENHYTPGKTGVSVLKVWEDNDNQDGLRKEEIKVQLYADDEKIGSKVKLSEANNWCYTWQNLPEKNNGQLIKYTIVEDKITGYEAKVNVDDSNYILLTNQYEPETTEFFGQKTWKNDDDLVGVRPDVIQVNLLANDNIVSTKIVSEKNDWNYYFDQLPVYNDGKKIEYHIQEKSVENYSTQISNNNIENIYTPKETSINIIKIWEDNDDEYQNRPDKVTMILYENNQKTNKQIILSEKNNWQADFKGLPIKKNNQLIKYTIQEKSVPGYDTKIVGNSEQGFVVVNSVNKKVTNREQMLLKTGEKQTYIAYIGILLVIVVILFKWYPRERNN